MARNHLYRVEIVDGLYIRHGFNVVAKDRYDAVRIVFESFNENEYGIPYWFIKDGIVKINIRLLTNKEMRLTSLVDQL